MEGQAKRKEAQRALLKRARAKSPFDHPSYKSFRKVTGTSNPSLEDHLNIEQRGTPYTGACGWWGTCQALQIEDVRTLIEDIKGAAEAGRDSDDGDEAVVATCRQALLSFDTQNAWIPAQSWLSECALRHMSIAHGVSILIVRTDPKWRHYAPGGSIGWMSLDEAYEITNSGTFDVVLGHDGTSCDEGTHWDVWLPKGPCQFPENNKGMLGPHLHADDWNFLTDYFAERCTDITAEDRAREVDLSNNDDHGNDHGWDDYSGHDDDEDADGHVQQLRHKAAKAQDVLPPAMNASSLLIEKPDLAERKKVQVTHLERREMVATSSSVTSCANDTDVHARAPASAPQTDALSTHAATVAVA